MTLSATAPGVFVGTLPYMSPEQLNGTDAGNTGDIWAFGCVLYEMLCARRAFDGDSPGATIASVLKGEPDWRQLPRVPDEIARLIRRCLRKDRTQRLQSIGDARIEVEDALSAPAGDTPPVSSGTHRWQYAAIAALAVVASVAAVAAFSAVRSPSPPPEMRLEIGLPATTRPTSLAISPDGLQLVYVAGLGSASPTLAPPARLCCGAATTWNRLFLSSVLVAGQRLAWVFRRRQAQTTRHRGRIAKSPGGSASGSGRDVEQGRDDHLLREQLGLVSHFCRGRRTETSDAGRTTPAIVPSISLVPARWSSLSVLCDGHRGLEVSMSTPWMNRSRNACSASMRWGRRR